MAAVLHLVFVWIIFGPELLRVLDGLYIVQNYDLWATKSEDVGLIVRKISFQDFQPMWS